MAAGVSAAPAPAEAASERPLVIAHRGASHYAPENTMAAFDLAMDLRSDLVETDVQRTKDGVLVLVHDTDLKRTTNIEQRYPGRRSYAVKDTTWAEIKTLDAGSWKTVAGTALGAMLMAGAAYVQRIVNPPKGS